MNNCHQQHHQYKSSKRNVALYAAIFIAAFGVVEALFGWWSGSLTLLGDAGHMGTDALTLLLAAFAIWMRQRPTTSKHTYGFARAEVLVSWVSSILLLAMIISIAIVAIKRLNAPIPIASKPVIIVAIIGLLINIITAWILHQGEKTINIRAAFLHVLSDLLGSVAVLASGLIIYFTGWTKIDPILSLFICVLILFGTINLLRESVLVLMEGTPTHIDLNKIISALKSTSGVKTIHDLHVWSLTSGVTLLTVHVVVDSSTRWPHIIDDLRALLQKEFDIEHSTIQIESPDQALPCVDCNGK